MEKPSQRGVEKTHKFRVRKDQSLIIKNLEKELPGKRNLKFQAQTAQWFVVCSTLTVTLTINTQIMHMGKKKMGMGTVDLNILLNQLPHLSGRWVPGIPRVFHCGLPAPR